MVRRIPQDRPVYKLLEPFFDPQDNWHPEGAMIAFDGTPNQMMMPLNDLAKHNYDAYMDKVDDGLREACMAEKPPRPFIPSHRYYDEPEDDVVDVSRGAAKRQADPEIKLGNRRKSGGGAEAVA